MNRAGKLLLLLLLIQLGWLGYLHNQERVAGGAGVSARLADVGPFHVDELHIDDPHDDRVQLLRRRDGWILPTLGDLPANSERIAALLEQLTSEDPGWAVAHTLAARQRFRVADYHFRRRVHLLAQGEPVATVFLGTSPGFRKVHARNADDESIYSIKLNLFDLPVAPGRWLDTELLELKAPLRIVADGYSLDRSSGQWRLGDGSRPDPRELAALLDVLQSLQVSDVADAALARSLEAREAVLVLEVESLTGTDTLSLHRHQEKHLVHSARWQQYFLISAYTFDTLTGIDAMIMSGTTEGD